MRLTNVLAGSLGVGYADFNQQALAGRVTMRQNQSTRLQVLRRFDGFGRLTGVTNRNGAGQELARFGYTHNQAKQRTRVEMGGTATNTAGVLVNGQLAQRHGDHYSAVVTGTNASQPVWMGITNLADILAHQAISRCPFGAAFVRPVCDRLAFSMDHMDRMDPNDYGQLTMGPGTDCGLRNGGNTPLAL